MSLVHFIPSEGTEYFEGWPCHVVGDGFIKLELVDWTIDDIRDCAMYEDQFGDEYQFEGVLEGYWYVEMRED